MVKVFLYEFANLFFNSAYRFVTLFFAVVIKLDRKSPGEGGLTFPDFSNPRIDRWDARHDVIALPSSVFDQGM